MVVSSKCNLRQQLLVKDHDNLYAFEYLPVSACDCKVVTGCFWKGFDSCTPEVEEWLGAG